MYESKSPSHKAPLSKLPGLTWWDRFVIKFLPILTVDVAKLIMDLFYLQTAVFIGMFYSPILSIIFPFWLILDFYIKNFVLFKNFAEDEILYKFPKGNAFFYLVMILSLLLGWLSFLTSLFSMTPSKYCGPFALNKFEGTQFTPPAPKTFNGVGSGEEEDQTWSQYLNSWLHNLGLNYQNSIWTHQVSLQGGVYQSVFGRFFITFFVTFAILFLILIIYLRQK